MTASLAYRIPAYAATAIGGLVAAGLASELVVPALRTDTPPQFKLLPGTGPDLGEGVIPFPGMGGAIDQFAPLERYFQSIGPTLLMCDGSNVRHTPAAVIRTILGSDLADRELTLLGLSMGTKNLVHCLWLCLLLGIRVRGVVIMSGALTRHQVKWSGWVEEHLTRPLNGGLLSMAAWHFMTAHDIRQAEAMLRDPAIDPATAQRAHRDAWRSRRTPARKPATSARLLRSPLRFPPGAFADTECLVIYREEDERIEKDFNACQILFPKAVLARDITIAGHATLGDAGCPEQYEDRIRVWRRDTLRVAA